MGRCLGGQGGRQDFCHSVALERAKWVQVAEDSALSADDIAAYIIEAHKIIAARLPRHVQQTLKL